MRTSVACVGILSVVIAACGGQDETTFTEPHRTGTLPVQRRSAVESRFFESEQDQFHANSLFESVRKKRLTNFGYTLQEPLVRQITRGQLHQEIIDAGIAGLSVSLFRTAQFVKPAFPFDYENDLGRLRELARAHRLDTLITEDMTELEQLVAVMDYTYRFMDGGTVPSSDDDPGPSAELITARRKDGIAGEARHYAALFCQLALSIGYNARLVGMHTIDRQDAIQSHMVVEVFMNNNRKWVVFDPYAAASYYSRDGVPLSAFELRGIMLDSNFRSVDVFSSAGDFTDVADRKERLLERYRYLYLFRMNDILSRSPRNGTMSWQELYQAHLVWEDGHSLVSDGQFNRIPAFSDTGNASFPLNGVRYVAHEVSEFNWDLNYTVIDFEVLEGPNITAHYNTVSPNFKEFLIEDDKFYTTTSYTHKVQKIAHAFIVTAVNEFGVPGQQSYVDFSW